MADHFILAIPDEPLPEPATRPTVHGYLHGAAIFLGAACLGLHADPAAAQLLSQYLPASVPGYEMDPVMAVVAAGGPDYSAPGIRAGGFVIKPSLDETMGFDENPLGLHDERGSALIDSSGSVSVNSDWSRNALGASFSLDNRSYPELPIADITTASAFAGGSLDLFTSDKLNVGAGYTSSALSPTSVLTQDLTAPVPFDIADARTEYVWTNNRLTLTPSIGYAAYRFGTAYSTGTVQDYSGLDKDQLTGGLTAAYSFLTGASAVVSYQEISAAFQHHVVGSANQDYLDALMLAGIRDEADAVFHWALLAGYENRRFAATGQGALSQPAFEAALTYYPTRLTTVEATFDRRLSDAGIDIAQNVTYTEAALRVDHALRRNVILTGRLDYGHTDASAGNGAHSQDTFSAGAKWLLSHNLQLSATYIFNYGSQKNGALDDYGLPSVPASYLNNQTYVSNVVMLSAHLQF
jgi:hypothetical protein